MAGSLPLTPGYSHQIKRFFLDNNHFDGSLLGVSQRD